MYYHPNTALAIGNLQCEGQHFCSVEVIAAVGMGKLQQENIISTYVWVCCTVFYFGLIEKLKKI